MKVIIEWHDGTYSLVTDHNEAAEIAKNCTAPGETTRLHKLIEFAVYKKEPNENAEQSG